MTDGSRAPTVDGRFAPRQSLGTALRTVAFAYRASWRLSRVRTLGLTLLPVIQGLLPAALAITVRGLVNAVATDGAVRSDAAPWILLSLGLAMVLATTVPLQRTLELVNSEHLEAEFAVRLLEHADTLEFAYFESPRFRDSIAQVTEMPGAMTSNLIDKAARVCSAFLTVVSLMAVLAAIEPGLLLWLPPVAIPYLLLHWWIARIRYETKRHQMRSRRWAEYFTESLFDERQLPEARLLNLSPLFQRRVEGRMRSIFVQNRALHRRELMGTIVFNALALGVIYFALWRVAENAIDGRVTVGDVAVFAGSVAAVRTAVDVFVSVLGLFRWNILNVRHLEHFLALPPVMAAVDSASPVRVTSEPPEVTSADSGEGATGLVVEHVRFAYPETERDVLRDVSFTVGPGETVALVGENGSGKTTLVKLLTGLYPPDAGTIRLGGSSTTDLTTDEIRRRVSVVFQQFSSFEATAAENIALGDWPRLLDDREAIQRIADDVGLASLVERLPDGLDTEVGRSFGSLALSGGQQQLFALARASARDVPIMVLDEPTANLDAQTEYELFRHFKRIAAGRATLLISHRFSTLALADRVVVLANGTAIEQGRHHDLIEADGLYARMYRQFRYPAEALDE